MYLLYRKGIITYYVFSASYLNLYAYYIRYRKYMVWYVHLNARIWIQHINLHASNFTVYIFHERGNKLQFRLSSRHRTTDLS